MAMAHVSSSEPKPFYLRAAPSNADFTKFAMDSTTGGYPSTECPSSWADAHFLHSELPIKAPFNPEVLSGEWQQFVDPTSISYSNKPEAPPPYGSGVLSLTVDPSKGGLSLQGLANNPHLIPEFPSDPGFAERAARYSSSFHYGQASPNKLSRTSSMRGDNNATEEAVKSALDEGKLFSKLKEAGLSPTTSLNSTHNSVDQGSRKRKAAEEKSKDAAVRKNAEADKRQKASEVSKDETKTKTERSSSENSGSSSPKSVKESAKPPEPPKQDYIHVRARRGQATDSHSLAERVRREKISERMKFLQDLVPGCSKVTGKAVMLDEIINYVQSLQRQVEFLSMKLAAVNPRLDLNLDSLLTKEVLQGRPAMLLNNDIGTSYTAQQLQQAQQAVMQLGTCGLDLRSLNAVDGIRPPPDAFGDSTSQASTVWDGELQSVVQMSFGGISQELQGHLPAGHMKVEI